MRRARSSLEVEEVKDKGADLGGEGKVGLAIEDDEELVVETEEGVGVVLKENLEGVEDRLADLEDGGIEIL